MALLSLQGVRVQIGGTEILRGVDLEVNEGETVGVVGESGCGKSLTALTIMGMLPTHGRITAGQALLDGHDLTRLSKKEWRGIRGTTVSMVMQDPFTSLNPMMRIGPQIAEVMVYHQGMSAREANAKAVEMLAKVGVPNPEASAQRFPHQLSGGQRQRVVIAISYAAKPKLLIADEPTTALDVTLQAQILRLIQDLQRSVGTAILLVSHDIGVIGSVSDRVAVFYAGRVIETGSAAQVLHEPSHPYTRMLLKALPQPGVERLATIPGSPPDFRNLPAGCAFAPRCPDRFERCVEEPDALPIGSGRACACWKVADYAKIES
ncbi:MAG: ABC transporter ATP-binding protein [Fimbriimonadaceae bacterium]|nr:ABC transporter ATP-binding protein [Fimbriimonadaceae bacterium]